MADTNFKVFNEEMNTDRTFSDSEYEVATQRQTGVIPGMALSRLHNKLYRQSSAMAKAIADFLVEQNQNCMDNDIPGITASLRNAILGIVSGQIGDEVETHNANLTAHADLLHLWKPNTAYAVGDIAFSSKLPSWAYLECIQAGTSGNDDEIFTNISNGGGGVIPDNTIFWRIKDIRNSGGESIGSIKKCLAKNPPPGWLALDTGAMVSRATYKELWTWVQENAPLVSEVEWQAQAAVQSSVGYYSSGDGSTTFRLPRILDYPRGGLASEVGQWQGDAIRNITGSFYSAKSTEGISLITGAFSDTTTSPTTTAGHTGTTSIPANATIRFEAGKVVPVADENRPRTIRFLYCVKAFDAVTNSGLVDITELAAELANKIDKSDQGYGTQLWISDEYTPVLNTPTIVAHGLTIDPIRCKSDVKLKCVSAEAGYAVGDYAISPVGVAQASSTEYWLCPALNDTTIQQNTAAGNMYALNKANGNYNLLTPAKWRYVFRIWY